MTSEAGAPGREGFGIPRVGAVIDKYGMLKSGDSVLVGVSGGCDSVSLLHILSFLSTERGFRVQAAHVNHHLRGAESDRDRDFVRSMCREYGIELHILEADISGRAKSERVSVEQAGRDARYEFFEQVAREMGGAKIATAHTLSDSAETFLFNMARGATIAGLCGIPAVRGKVIRPLIETTRQELERFCGENGISYVTDSTNLTDDYARNRLRHNAVPALLAVNPSFEKAFARLTSSLSADRDYMDGRAREALEGARTAGGYSGGALRELHPAIKMRTAAALLSEFGFECDYARTEWICERLGGEDFKIELARDRYLEQREGELFASEKERPCPKLETGELHLGENPLSDGRTLFLEHAGAKTGEISEKIHQWVLKNRLDSDRINGILVVRARREGDKLDLGGGARTLKKLFSEAKIPVSQRGGTAVVADSLGPVWAEGIGAAKRAAVSAETKNALLIKIINDEISEGAAT